MLERERDRPGETIPRPQLRHSAETSGSAHGAPACRAKGGIRGGGERRSECRCVVEDPSTPITAVCVHRSLWRTVAVPPNVYWRTDWWTAESPAGGVASESSPATVAIRGLGGETGSSGT